MIPIDTLIFLFSLTLQAKTPDSSQVATRQVSLNVPVVLGPNKTFTTHSEAWRGLEALCQPVHFLNKHHLFGGCSTSYTPIPVHLFYHPTSPCSSFANATVSALLAGPAGRQDGEHGGHPLPSLRSSHPDDWYTKVHPTASALPSLLSPTRGSELNSGNMSSSVYLTLPAMALAMS